MTTATPRHKIVDGIPCFSEDRYWGKAPKEELEKALAVIQEQGWDEFRRRYKDAFDATFEENRADWRFPIPLSRDSVVLDAGAGMGRSSIPLARVVGKVVAVDPSFLRMKFLKLRAEKEGLKNIDVYVGDLFDVPFEKGSFDLIVMNGLLEWIGATDKYTEPREAQLAALRLAKDLLKDGGHLYIGIENRAAFAYLYALDHSGLRFTSYLPRPMADWYCRLRKGARYDTYTYTARGYRKLLSEAGFGAADFYLVYPGYNCPRITIPYGDLNLLAYVIRRLMPQNSWRRRLASRLAGVRPLLVLYRSIFFSFNIIAKK
ncbi:MAG: methyltransferase domain-containing protein [Candidatus Pacebacteria bacterium]|nr:methyltransferase domain-containing protein [Candidatus Paceibacterota bacterium]